MKTLNWRDFHAFHISYEIVSQFGEGEVEYIKRVVLGRDFEEAMKICGQMYGQKRYLKNIGFQILDITDLGHPEGLYLFDRQN